MTHKCSAYLNVPVEDRSQELAEMYLVHPTPAEYSPEFPVPDSTTDEKFTVDIVVFATSHPNTSSPVDATTMSTEQLVATIVTHTGDSAVQMSVLQASNVYNVLHVSDENDLLTGVSG